MHRAVAVGRHFDHRPCAQTDEAQGPIDGAMPLRARDDPDPWRADQAVAFHVPVHRPEHLLAGGEQPHRVGRLPPGHEADGRVLRDAEQVLQPVTSGFLRHGRSR